MRGVDARRVPIGGWIAKQHVATAADITLAFRFVNRVHRWCIQAVLAVVVHAAIVTQVERRWQMTAFDTTFAARALPRLLVNFGEPIVYYPRNGKPRTITAIVDRDPPRDGGDFDEHRGPRFSIEVTNDQIDGIASDCIDMGGDRVEFAQRKGAAAVQMSLVQLVDQDAGMLRIEVR